jgi:SNW domain-containing protein 1
VIPPYGQREGWQPKTPEDFDDGGAFPEIHIPQYPLGMGKKKSSSTELVPLTSDGQGNMRWDAIVQRSGMVVHSRPQDLLAKSFQEEDLQRPSEDEIAAVTERTKAALEGRLDKKIKSSNPSHVPELSGNVSYVRYTPANNTGHNSGASQRIIRMVETPIDPLEPSKFRNTKTPRGPPSPPVPIMHSPPKKVTKEEQEAWRVPPSISNWKNNKGYTIPLDKRLAADGRGLQEVQVNSGFAKLSEVLYIAERNAREEIAKRAAIEKKLALQAKEKREEDLRQAAQQARLQRAGIVAEAMANETEDERQAREDRESVLDERRREREREHRLEKRGSKAKAAAVSATLGRDSERDISEKIALGQSVQRTQESMYDSRLFNQTAGMDSGFGHEEDYNIFDKALFGGEREHALYKAPGRDNEVYGGGAADLDKIVKSDRFRPDKDFSGVDRSQPSAPRSGPVEFEREPVEEDPFGLDKFLNDAKSGRKRDRDAPPSRGPQLGVMHAVAGGSGKADEYRDAKRAKINFESKGEMRSLGDQMRGGDRDRDDRRDYDRDRDYDRRDDRRDDRRERDYDRRDDRRDDRRERDYDRRDDRRR